MSSNLNKYLDEYAESHQNKNNILIHLFAVPVIVFCVLGLLKALPVPENWPLWLDWSSVISLLVISFYSTLKNIRIVLEMATLFILDIIILECLRPHFFILCFFLFIFAWIFQFIGHKIEGKKPAFFKDIFFLLIGPIWVIKHIKENFNNAKDI